jgi:hypothetical protein
MCPVMAFTLLNTRFRLLRNISEILLWSLFGPAKHLQALISLFGYEVCTLLLQFQRASPPFSHPVLQTPYPNTSPCVNVWPTHVHSISGCSTFHMSGPRAPGGIPVGSELCSRFGTGFDPWQSSLENILVFFGCYSHEWRYNVSWYEQ